MLLYVHIPFCRTKCRYCSFVSFTGQETQAQKYVRLLIKEAETRRNEFSGEIETVFIGGGTPSLLAPGLLTYLTQNLFSLLPSERISEFTVEANPGTVTGDWMEAAVKAGVNRISMGMQAFQPALLKTLGRCHTYRDVEDSVMIARDSGIRNINIDLIFGIPGQTQSQWKETLAAALALAPVHISAYGLIPEENTPLGDDLEKGVLRLPEPDLEREMYDTAISMLAGKGFRQYEISNFAMPGYECRHNIGYWKQIPYVGLGVSAASMAILQHGMHGMFCRRRTNPCQLSGYEKMILEHGKPEEDMLVSADDACFETMMLGLRMNEGVSEKAFMELHGVAVFEKYGKKLQQLESQKLLVHADGRWRLTRRGFDIQNSILVELMET